MVLRIPLGKIIVCLIAFIHLIFLYDGIASTVEDDQYYAKDIDLQYEEKVQAVFLYGFHFILIYLLIYSVLKNSSRFLMPWLGTTFPVFVYMTFMVLRDMRQHFVVSLLESFRDVAICWFFWSFAYFIFKTGEYRNSDILEKSFIYSSAILKRGGYRRV